MLKMIGSSTTKEEVAPYPTKERLLEILNNDMIPVLIANGNVPPGSKVINVRVRDVQILIETPDGQHIERGALLVPVGEKPEQGPPSYFQPPGHGHG